MNTKKPFQSIANMQHKKNNQDECKFVVYLDKKYS